MLLPSMSLDEIRRRVREAEALLRVAAQHARDAHDDPTNNEHANARIQSICREVEGLFPGMHEPAKPDNEVEEALAGLKAAAATAQAEREAAGEGKAEADAEESAEAEEADEEDEGDEEQEEDEDGEEEVEWDVDYVKLGAAIENEELMSKFPEPARSAFKRAARYLVESHERQELFGRVLTAFETLSQLTAQNVEDTRRKLALAMTMEELASKHKA